MQNLDFSVVHSKHQLTKRIEPPKGLVSHWRGPKRSIGGGRASVVPSQSLNRDWKTRGSYDSLLKYVHAFLWRRYLAEDADLKK